MKLGSIKLTSKEIKEARFEFECFLRGKCGSCYTHIFRAILASHPLLLKQWAKAFPDLLYICLEYQDLLQRFNLEVDGQTLDRIITCPQCQRNLPHDGKTNHLRCFCGARMNVLL